MIDYFKNWYNWLTGRYQTSHDGVIVSCFYNPENSVYRLIAFQKFYESIKHLNHRIIECAIGDAPFQLPASPYITQIRTESLLWHKETLLNKLIKDLPKKFKYVFWIDADVKFTNKYWMTEAVQKLRREFNILQLFDYCIHLKRDELKPSFNVDYYRPISSTPSRHPDMWTGFGYNYIWSWSRAADEDYHRHGHVGFAWGARREILEEVPLYEKALIGGADHIIAHAAASHIPHKCIRKSFTADIENVENWMTKFDAVVKNKLGYVSGDLYHYWHGDRDKREYLKRIQEFTEQSKCINEKDKNGLFVGKNNEYIKKYYKNREVGPKVSVPNSYCNHKQFQKTMGYNWDAFFMGMIIHDILDGETHQCSNSNEEFS